MRFPKAIQDLIDDFSNLPTVGPKTAQRYVFYLLKQPQEILERISKNINNLKKDLRICSHCQAIAQSNPCQICSDSKRNRSLLCIIATQPEMLAIESTGKYNGLYFLLGKNLRPQDGLENENNKINIKNLITRIEKKEVKEVILALSPTIEGETTSMYLIKLLKPYQIKITKLARGLPMGSDIEYADEITLNNAMKNRSEV